MFKKMMRKMLWRFPKNRQKVLAEVDEFMESFGNDAYREAKKAEREAWQCGDKKLGEFLYRVRMEIAKRTDIELGLDTATRYLEKSVPVVRPTDSTLH
ncbi:MAG: hypothetical protein KF854_00835 [Nitrospira sp.]|nr:hypothetical protein [Nitrospira sp.]MBX3513120.1 hypothetical protein [Xanthobacteraceae bacterium]